MLELIPQLVRDEGEILHAYQDSLGFWTIGIGRLIDVRNGGGITHEEAGLLLLNDIKKHRDDVLTRLPWAAGLSKARLGVLINMHFQLGNGLFSFTQTLLLVQTGQYAAAATAMLASRWAQQTPQRALRAATQMRTDTWQ
jgi:lysozyme